MTPKNLAIIILATLTLATILIVNVNSTAKALTTQTPEESSPPSLTQNETIPQTNQPLTQANSTIPQSTLGNSTSESDEQEALSRVSHPKVLATPNVQPAYAAVNPTSTPSVVADLHNLGTTLNVSELIVMPTSEPATKTSILDPQTPAMPLQSPQPAIAPIGTAKDFLSQAILAVVLIVATSTIAVALYVARKSNTNLKNN
jgi:hypothetical protein